MSQPLDLSVVVPLYNERAHVAETIASAARAVADSVRFRGEIVVVDDGSTDRSGEAARAVATDVPVRVLTQANQGRFAARRTGLEAARGEYVLFLDAGVTLVDGGLRFVGDRVAAGEDVWNGHTIMEDGGNPFGRFWSVVGALAFAEYLRAPRTTSFGADEFDRYPKGTGCFFAPRRLLVEACAGFRSAYRDTRYANDDAPIIRAIAAQRPIHISPQFACVYRPRSSFVPFVRHAFHRGTVFLDGHGRRESRFFLIVLAFYPASLGCAYLIARRPLAAPALVVATALVAGVAARRQPRANALSFAVLAPVYALAHGAGMWRGLAMAAAKRLRL